MKGRGVSTHTEHYLSLYPVCTGHSKGPEAYPENLANPVNGTRDNTFNPYLGGSRTREFTSVVSRLRGRPLGVSRTLHSLFVKKYRNVVTSFCNG